MRDHDAAFAREAASALPCASPVVEIGARPAEGQQDSFDPRALFGGLDYIGCDVQPGARVDRIEDVQALSFEDGSVGGIIDLDTLKHVADPIRAVQEMWRVLRPGGVVVMTSVMFFPIHAHPFDYWRFTPEGFSLLLNPFEQQLVLAYGWPDLPESVFGIGVKGSMPVLDIVAFLETSARLARWGDDRRVDFGPIRLGVRELWGHTLRATSAAARRRLAQDRA